MRVTQQAVDKYLQENAPHLATHRTPTRQVGIYRKDLGPAASFRSCRNADIPESRFSNWADVLDFLQAQDAHYGIVKG